MPIEESGTVVEVRERTALVRLRRTPACAECASALQCHTGRDAGERLLEARNDVGAVAGDAVLVAVSARAVINASARIYILPVVGLLIGAGVAQLLAGTFISPQAGGTAAGFGGIAGAVLAALYGRRAARRAATGMTTLPRISAVVGVDSRPRRD